MADLVQTLNNVGTVLSVMYGLCVLRFTFRLTPPTGHKVLGIPHAYVAVFLFGFMACVLLALYLKQKGGL